MFGPAGLHRALGRKFRIFPRLLVTYLHPGQIPEKSLDESDPATPDPQTPLRRDVEDAVDTVPHPVGNSLS